MDTYKVLVDVCSPRSHGSAAAQCMKNPVPIGVGYLAQYIVKPLLGFMIAKVPSHPVYWIHFELLKVNPPLKA